MQLGDERYKRIFRQGEVFHLTKIRFFTSNRRCSPRNKINRPLQTLFLHGDRAATPSSRSEGGGRITQRSDDNLDSRKFAYVSHAHSFARSCGESHFACSNRKSAIGNPQFVICSAFHSPFFIRNSSLLPVPRIDISKSCPFQTNPLESPA